MYLFSIYLSALKERLHSYKIWTSWVTVTSQESVVQKVSRRIDLDEHIPT